jgi:hypothetical protein
MSTYFSSFLVFFLLNPPPPPNSFYSPLSGSLSRWMTTLLSICSGLFSSFFSFFGTSTFSTAMLLCDGSWMTGSSIKLLSYRPSLDFLVVLMFYNSWRSYQIPDAQSYTHVKKEPRSRSVFFAWMYAVRVPRSESTISSHFSINSSIFSTGNFPVLSSLSKTTHLLML